MKTKFNLRTVNVTRYISPAKAVLCSLAGSRWWFQIRPQIQSCSRCQSLNRWIDWWNARALGMKMPSWFCKSRRGFWTNWSRWGNPGFTAGESRNESHCTSFLAQLIDPVVTVVDPAMASQIVCWTRISLMSTVLSETPICWFGTKNYGRSRASLYFHHFWTNWEKHAQSPFALIKDHVLLPQRWLKRIPPFKQLLTPKC
jgi:hypothetical protein